MLGDPAVLGRFQAKLVEVPGSTCLWWTGAVSGRSGHGRFWLGEGRVMIAHRFSYAVATESGTLPALLAHRCDNPLCQRIDRDHVVPSTASRNRVEWVVRRHLAGGTLADPRGSYGRAVALRNLARLDPSAVSADLEQLRRRDGVQLTLF